ncbi:hypothetical protein Ahy_A10g048871 [Arachis hypogaea]|uniref:Transposase MuDR plant domain-containing protein n=1 Tax=Arachis hypogaea TaxID=3818 RepID=A0A445B652_ARAHY|nr:hypothetical protein Ahy_A10g048871 [Arachis hypogaea]
MPFLFVGVSAIVADGKFVVRMEFNSREVVIAAVKEYTIQRSVNYKVYELKPTTFYTKCIQYGTSCNYWVVTRASDLPSLKIMPNWDLGSHL